eukprot:4985634-Amphidinium_carterae.1
MRADFCGGGPLGGASRLVVFSCFGAGFWRGATGLLGGGDEEDVAGVAVASAMTTPLDWTRDTAVVQHGLIVIQFFDNDLQALPLVQESIFQGGVV